MRVDFGLQRARVRDKERQDHLWRVVRAVIASLAVGGAGLIFGFAVGLHDARWAGAWMVVGDASSPLSAQDARGASSAADRSHHG